MKRASRKTRNGRHEVEVSAGPTRSRRGHITEAAVRTPEPRRAAARRKPSEVAAALDSAANTATAEKKSLTTADFLRAAGTPKAEVFAEGESHPDEMDERVPLPAAVKPAKSAVHAQVSANEPSSTPTVAPAARVSGFGAEGEPAPGHRTIAATLAAHRNTKPEPAPTVSAEERAKITDEVVKPMVLPTLYTPGGRLIMPAPLKGSHEVLVHQNVMADNEGLDRIQDDTALNEMVAQHLLTRLPESESLHVNGDLPENRRYARPWAVRFATDMAHAYAARFHEPLQLNSAVRTVSYQLRLMRVNGNAAAVDGDTASPHLTGQALDFGKRGMSKAEIAWMRGYLLPLMQAGKIDVEEEFQQACFHISVYRNYMPKKAAPRAEVAQVHADSDGDAPEEEAPIVRRKPGPSIR